MSRPFTAKKPAPNIDTLLDYLKKEDGGQYLYRGQTRHHGNLLPSVFRRAWDRIAPTKPGRHRVSDTIYNANKDQHWTYKHWMMDRAIKTFGRGLGNIVAQQYGFSSEAIDVTSDID